MLTMFNMTRARLFKVGRKTLVCVCLIVLFSTLLIGYTRLDQYVPSDVEESLRHRRDLSDNDTLSISPCTQELVPVDGTVEMIVRSVNEKDNYVSLVGIGINFTNNDLLSDVNKSNQTVWHWGLGKRGRFLLKLPYDARNLSWTTLKYGMHSVNITFNNSMCQINSVNASSLAYSLSKLLRQVRSKIDDIDGDSSVFTNDTICEEQYLESPFFIGTWIPGYSLFNVQSRFSFHCWEMPKSTSTTCDLDNCLGRRSYINCPFVAWAFKITYGLLGLTVLGAVHWTTYRTSLNQGRERRNQATPNINNERNTTTNILKIPWFPIAITTENRWIYHISFSALLFSIPLLIYVFTFLVYNIRVDKYQRAKIRLIIWYLDHILANLLYIVGAVVFFGFYCMNRDKLVEKPYKQWHDWKCLVIVAGLCFCRFSAAAMLVVEMVLLTMIGIAINIHYGKPTWINYIAGAIYVITQIINFFDKYQDLLNQICYVGEKVDKESKEYNYRIDDQHDRRREMILTETDNGFTIKLSLLRDIIWKWLPFLDELLKSFAKLIVAFVVIVLLAYCVSFIDEKAKISSTVEYVITIIPFIAAIGTKAAGCTCGGKAKNQVREKLLKMEKDFIEFAEKGTFPKPDSSQWVSFKTLVLRKLCCCCSSCCWCCRAPADHTGPPQDDAQSEAPADLADSQQDQVQSEAPDDHTVAHDEAQTQASANLLDPPQDEAQSEASANLLDPPQDEAQSEASAYLLDPPQDEAQSEAPAELLDPPQDEAQFDMSKYKKSTRKKVSPGRGFFTSFNAELGHQDQTLLTQTDSDTHAFNVQSKVTYPFLYIKKLTLKNTPAGSNYQSLDRSEDQEQV